MKTRVSLIVFFTLGILVTVNAQNDNSANQNKQNVNQQKSVERNARGVWIDTDNDGVCDKLEAYGTPGRGFVPVGRNGLASDRVSAPGWGYRRGFRGGRGYIAEQPATPGNRQGLPAGQGRGFGPGYGRGFGPGGGAGKASGGRFYSDQNNNGVCDHYEGNLKKY